MTTVKDLIMHLERDYHADDKIAVAIWQVDDVRIHADCRGLRVSEELAVTVIERMDRNHDASSGYTLDTIEYWLERLMEEGVS